MSYFHDQKAQWISVRPMVSEGENGRCPAIPRENKMVYFAKLDIEQDGEYFVELLADDYGVIQLWRSFSPYAIALQLNTGINGAYQGSSVSLKKGTYGVMMEVRDIYGTDTAGVASIQDWKGATLLRTSADGTWSGYEVSTRRTAPEIAKSERVFE